MKYVQVQRTFRGAREGWVTRGTIFNVGIEYRPGLAIMDEARARELERAKYVKEYAEGETVLAPEKEDPIRQRQERAEAQRTRATAKRRGTAGPQPKAPPAAPMGIRSGGGITMQDNRRLTKVDPPARTKKPAPAPAKGGKQPTNPPAPRRAGAASSTSTAPAPPPPPTSTPGGQTGAAPASPSSAAAAPAQKPSTGGPRGIRRGTDEHKARAGSSPSTRRGASSQAPTPSTAPIGVGGDTAKDADSSKD